MAGVMTPNPCTGTAVTARLSWYEDAAEVLFSRAPGSTQRTPCICSLQVEVAVHEGAIAAVVQSMQEGSSEVARVT